MLPPYLDTPLSLMLVINLSVFACDEDFTTSPGQFNSPNYPDNYPDETTCRFKITSAPDEAVILVCENFKTCIPFQITPNFNKRALITLPCPKDP